MCKIADGETKLGAKVEEVKSFFEAEIEKMDIASDHEIAVEYASSILMKIKALL